MSSNPTTATVLPIIRVDFNDGRRPLLADGGLWQFTPGQPVVLDDHEGLKAQGRFARWLGPTVHAPDNRLAYFEVDENSYEDYEPES